MKYSNCLHFAQIATILLILVVFYINLYAQNFGLSGYTKEFWLKADEAQSVLPTDGASVFNWEDKSGKGLHFVQVGNTAVPTFSYNGFNYQPSLYWQGYSGTLNQRGLQSNATFTPSTSKSYYVFTVSKPVFSTHTSPYSQTIVKFHVSNSFSNYVAEGTNVSWASSHNNNNNGGNALCRVTTGYGTTTNRFTGTNSGNGFNTNDKHYGLVSWICPNNSNGTSGPINEIWLNGRKSPYWDGSGNNAAQSGRGASWMWHTVASNIKVGQGGPSDYFPFAGDIQEVILLSRSGNSVMPTNDFQKVQSYLAVKYGLMLNPQSGDWLNSNDDIIWDASDATYHNNVFGLGKDSGSGLNTKQSHSTENPNFTAFFGNIATLNVQNNNNTLSDMQYVMFGHNNKFSTEVINIADGAPYQNGNISVSTGLNFQTEAIYKTQLTNINTTINVKLKVGFGYSYAFVSTSDAFNPNTTKIYNFDLNGIVDVELDNTYKYIRFVGFANGPGNVGTNLRLWLRADDNNMLTIENLDASDPKIQNSGTSGTVRAVAEWTDNIRNKTYSWYNKGTDPLNQRMPLYNPRSIQMNFHPAVTFYGNGVLAGSYLRCNQPITNVAKPAKHTAIFLTNNDFSTNAWVYLMSFNSQMGSYQAPQYGVEKSWNNIIGRMRISGAPGGDRVINSSSGQSLFSIGSTTIGSYYLNLTNMTFRFNGVENVVNNPYPQSLWEYFDMTGYSIISGGFDEDRIVVGDIGEVIIYEDELNPTEINQVESYLAFKYGITLRTNVYPNRYHYKINSGLTSVWDGTQTSGKFVDFYNRVAAVVRDDQSNLNNKESHSTEEGTLLHLGVAGKKLGGNNPELGELENGEAIAFGHNNDFGITPKQVHICGEFTHRFNTVWFIHKVTKNDRPIKMMVGAENNLPNVLGQDAPQAIKDYYNKLTSAFDVYMIVANSPADIISGNYKTIVPMDFINGEHQCKYEFTQEDTYITFGYRQTMKFCVGELDFNGAKTFNWNQYTPTNYGTSNINVQKGVVDLGNGLQVNSSSVVYESGVNTLAFYPHKTGSVLQILRRSGASGSAVTTTINFNVPVEGEFNISGLDYFSGGFEEIIITGHCNGGNIYPKLSYACNKNLATYSITGNTAIVKKQIVAGNGDVRGRVNVVFDQAVTQIVIQYKINGVVNNSLQSIYISPITLRAVPPPPPINEDGLAFLKYASCDSISTCETIDYTFEINNTNCEDKMIHFQDILNSNMRWASETLALDSVNEARIGSININNYGTTTTLTIDSLLVKAQDKIHFTVTSYIDKNYVYNGWQNFENSSRIDYKMIINSVLTPRQFYSFDKYTLDSLSIVSAKWEQRHDEAIINVTSDKVSYIEDDEMTITYTINNPNGPILACLLYLNFNPNWTYKNNSFVGPNGTYFVYPNPTNSPYFFFAGSSDGSSGFTLPNGTTTFSVTFISPTLPNIGYEIIAGQTVREYFRIKHVLESAEEDPCIIASLLNTTDEKAIPFCNMDLQTVPSISNCVSVDLTDASATQGSILPQGTVFEYYWDINQNGIVDQTENSIANPQNITISGHYLIRAISCDTITNSVAVTIKQTSTSSTTKHICTNNLPFTWNDTTFSTGTSAGTYNYTYHTTNAAGCDSTANLILTISAPYTNTITAAICTGQSYNQNGFNENTTGIYTQNLQTVDGCDSIIKLNLTVNSLPTAGITNNSGTTILTCGQSNISVTATGGTSYLWSHGLGTNQTITISNDDTFTVTVSDNNGCSATKDITITADASMPNPHITSNSGTILTCNLQQISITASGGDTYQWSHNLGTNATVTINTPDNYTVTATNTATGCTASTGITITQNITTPTVGITNNAGKISLTCSLTSISVTAIGGDSYVWNSGLGSSANATITSPGTYTVTATNATNGCTNTASITITENKTVPISGINNNTGTSELTCNLTQISLTATGGDSYAWSGGLGSSANATIISPGTYTVTAIGTNGCTSTSQITITQNITTPNSGINTSTNTLNCSTSSIQLTANGGISYIWSNNLGTNPTVTVNAAGTYYVTAKGSNGCTSQASVTISENKTAPGASITNNSATTTLTCSQQNISVTATSTTSGVTYLWSGGQGTNANINITTSGTHEVTVANPANGCTNTASITITENKTIPTIGINKSPNANQLTCSLTSIQLNAIGSGNYQWSNGTSAASTTVTTPGIYTVTVTSTLNGCTASLSEFITQDISVPTITGNTSSFVGQTVQLIGTSSGGTWSVISNAIVDNNGLVTGTGQGIAEIFYTLPNGCKTNHFITFNCNDFILSNDYYNDIIHNGHPILITKESGYTSVETIVFTISSNNCNIDGLSLIWMENTGNFTLDISSLSTNLNAGMQTTFSLTPALGLPHGVYRAKLKIVNTSNNQEFILSVKFKVKMSCCE